jgi:tripartite-type tricarboxylate transporter receptor subunit TctC
MILLKVPIFILAMQEIVVMTAKRPSILPTIQEDGNEATYSIVRGVIISPSSMY